MFIYKTTNLLNGKIYIGQDSKNNPKYFGSGLYLNKSIKKYGIENFKKEILFSFNSKEEALLKEEEIVDMLFVDRQDTYNFKIGGEGGWDHIPKMIKENPLYKEKFYSKVSASLKRGYKEGRLKGWKNMEGHINGFKGKHHSVETKKILSEKNKIPIESINLRLNDIDEAIKIYAGTKTGFIGYLARKWKLSHTQSKRFIEYHFKMTIEEFKESNGLKNRIKNNG